MHFKQSILQLHNAIEANLSDQTSPAIDMAGSIYARKIYIVRGSRILNLRSGDELPGQSPGPALG